MKVFDKVSIGSYLAVLVFGKVVYKRVGHICLLRIPFIQYKSIGWLHLLKIFGVPVLFCADGVVRLPGSYARV
jgi:hypothetical protein